MASDKVLALGGNQQRAVLALLLVHSPDAVAADQVIEEIWGDRPPATAPHAVQVHVSALRKLLHEGGGGAALHRSASGYSLEVDPECVDARRFERLVADAQHAMRERSWRRRELLDQALALWRGRPFGELSRFEFARREAERLEELHAEAVECLMDARLDCGEHAETIAPLTALVAGHPLREGPRRLLMLALYRSGRHAEALAVYRDACAALDEVGLQPGPELRALEQAILRHDRSLQSTVARGGARTDGDALMAPTLRRKVVTVLCCDVAASARDGDELDPEPLLKVTDRWSAGVEAIVERHGGAVVRRMADALLAVFGVPRAHEDDGLRAVRAAAEIRESLPAVARQLGVALSYRAAVNTGVVLAGAGDALALGNAVNLAARLEQAAAPDEILLDHETLALARDAVAVEAVGALPVAGRPDPMPAFRLLRVDPRAPATKRRLDLPLVGRRRELGLLRAAFDRVVQERTCGLLALLGTAGVGKTRLVLEFLGSLGDSATVFTGRCLHYGEGVTFWPMIEALVPVGERARGVLRRIGAGGVATPAELFWEIGRVLEAVASERPLILHVDDLQWAEPMLLDLLGHVVASSQGAPILVLCTARPELLEDHLEWTAKLHATTFTMEPLDAADCERLLEQLGDRFPAETREHMIAVSGGNPLYLEEIASHVRERGTVTVPATIHALLAARLERLDLRERELLECAAVEGEVFHLDAVGALEGADVGASLGALLRTDLIQPHASPPDALQTFAFRHLLIRDAAYQGTTKHKRARLHARFADWVHDAAPQLPERDEIMGWHLERAVGYRRELGESSVPEVAARAAEHLHAAGRRAGQRGDAVAARKLLARAYDLAARDDAQAARIAVDLAEQLIDGGDLTRVDALLSVAEQDVATAAHAALVRLHWLILAQPERGPRAIAARLPETFRRLAESGDESGLAKAHLAGFWAESQGALRTELAGEHARLAAEHARRAGDQGLRARALGLYIAALMHGTKDAPTLAQELDAIAAQDVGPYVASLLLAARGEIRRLDGDLDGARGLIHEAIERFKAMRINTMLASCVNWLAWSELAGGDPATALPGLLEIDAELEKAGERSFRSTIQATTAEVYARLGEIERARAAVRLAEELVAHEDHLTLVGICAARARLTLAADDPAAAERAARDAVAHADRMDVPFLRGHARLELGLILRARGREPEASAAGQEALAIFRAKGDQPRIREALAFLGEPPPERR